jgi:drug/metabolite transporter (DMT)-like permease
MKKSISKGISALEEIDVHGGRLLHHIAIVVTVVIWGGLSISIKYLLREISSISVSISRVYPAALLGILFLLFSRKGESIDHKDWPRLILASIFGFFAVNYVIPIGHKYITAGVGTLTIATTPIWAAIFALLFLKEKLTKAKILGILIAVSGLVIVMLFGGSKASFEMGNIKGILITILGPMFFALYSVLGRPLTRSYKPSNLTCYGLIIGMVLFIPFLSVKVLVDFLSLSNLGWFAIFYFSVVATFLAFQFWYFGLSGIEATKAIVYTNLTPFVGLIGATLVLGERITFLLVLGGCIIVAGIILTNRY